MSYKEGKRFGLLFAHLEFIIFVAQSKVDKDSKWWSTAEELLNQLESLEDEVDSVCAYKTLLEIDRKCDVFLAELQENEIYVM